MARTGGKAFFYGAANTSLVSEIVSRLPFIPVEIEYAAEHYGRGLKIDWSNKQLGARRRNYTAAMTCCALIIVGHPKFTDSITTAFRQRGRRIFWWTGKRLQEVDTKMIKIGTSKPIEFLSAFSSLPKTATFEPTLWTTQREEREAQIRTYLDQHPEKQRTPDEIPTFGWEETFNEDEIECGFDWPEDQGASVSDWLQILTSEHFESGDVIKRFRRSKRAEL